MSEIKEATKWWAWFVAIIIATVIISTIVNFTSKPAQVLDRVTNPDHIITSYEWYEEAYHSILNICNQIKNVQQMANEGNGATFKDERIIHLKNRLSTFVSDYNAKSKMISKNMWKSSDLPHTILITKICNEQ